MKRKSRYLIVLFLEVSVYSLGYSSSNSNFIRIELWKNSGFIFADIIVEDQYGRKTGYDILSKQEYNNIPHANYYDEDLGDDISMKSGRLIKIFSLEDAFTSEYKITVVGGTKTSYNLTIYTTCIESGEKKFSFSDTIDRGETKRYRLNYSTDTSVPITVSIQTPGLPVKLLNSQNQLLPDGTLKYYDGGWKDAINNGDGTFRVETERTTVSLRMTYGYASQDKANVPTSGGAVIFQTVPCNVQLRDSQGQLIDEGAVKYYAGGWRDFGVTSGGVAVKELLPNSYAFRMTYAYASNDKTQDIGTDPTVVFATVPAQVELRDSQNQLMDGGTVQYYSGGWRTFGATSGGVSVKELLPNSYSFRMTYGFASNDKSQDVSLDPTVVFETVPVQVELRNSQNQLMDEGAVKYYSGGWRDFGVTSSGVSVKELLPNNYAFRMTYAYASNDKNQDVSLDPTVVFPTVSVQVELKDSQNQLMDGGTVQYYSGGWRIFGATSGGVAHKELLPNSYPFRMTYGFASLDLTQDIRATPTVTFQTVSAKVELRDSQDRLMDQGTVQYYSGGWRDFGVTSGGVARKELLAKSYPFRLEYAYASTDRDQNLAENETVLFETVRTVVRVKNAQGELVDGATVRYYSGGWRDFGITFSGVAEKELLPKTYPFRVIYSGVQKDVEQDVSANPVVEVTLD